MKLPAGWNKIKLYQFKELRQIDKTAGYFSFQLDSLAVLLDVPSEDLEDLSIDEITAMYESIKWFQSEPKKNYKHELVLEEQTYILQPFKKLTLFEFIDLEYFLTNDYINHISHIASVFYRRVDADKWENVEFEPYIFSPFDRYELFDDLYVTEVYGILTDYMKYREDFMNKYEHLFNETDDEDDEEQLDVKDFDSIEDYKASLEQKEQGKRSKKWGWEALLFDLCEGDLTKIEEIGKLPLIFVFNMLAMRKEMGYLETSKF